MSMLVRRPSPYDELFSLRQAVDRLFDPDFAPVPSSGSAGAPSTARCRSTSVPMPTR